MDKQISYRKRTIILIVFLSLFRLLPCSLIELGNDETYYWVYSQYLQWNYFDHPPMIALWVRFFTGNLILQDQLLFLRLGSVLACAGASIFIYQIGLELQSPKAGWISVCLYNASFYAGLTAGMLIMPDAPQMLFWTFCLWMLTKIFKEEGTIKWWILFGIGSGLCIMSKVHGVYIWVGLVLYILLYNRKMLQNKGIYIAAAITMLLISPILLWNIKNSFVTYRFHSERIIIHGYLFNINNFIAELLQEVVVNNPVNFILIISVLVKWKEIKNLQSVLRCFVLIGVSLIIVVLFLSLFRNTRPIWSGPGYVTLIPLTSYWLAHNNSKYLVLFRKIAVPLFIITVISLWLFIETRPGTYGVKQPNNLGRHDISLDQYGWEKAGRSFAGLYAEMVDKGQIKLGTPLICNNWWGAHEEFYFARPAHTTMIGLGPVMELHQYMWTNFERLPMSKMDTAICIIHSDENYDAKKAYNDYYSTIDTVGIITSNRNKIPAHRFYVLKLTGWHGKVPFSN